MRLQLDLGHLFYVDCSWQTMIWKFPPALIRGWKITERTSGSADARLDKGLGNIIFMTFFVVKIPSFTELSCTEGCTNPFGHHSLFCPMCNLAAAAAVAYIRGYSLKCLFAIECAVSWTLFHHILLQISISEFSTVTEAKLLLLSHVIHVRLCATP